MRTLLVIGLGILLAGCGGATGDTAPDRTSPGAPADAAPPTAPAPKLDSSLSGGPPPAWLETAAGSFWLGYGSYCWTGGCADFVGPSCDDPKHTPKITVGRGGTVTTHLGFKARELSLSHFPAPRQREELQPQLLASGRQASWRVERAGAYSLFARAAAGEVGSDASYVACLVFE